MAVELFLLFLIVKDASKYRYQINLMPFNYNFFSLSPAYCLHPQSVACDCLRGATSDHSSDRRNILAHDFT